MSPAELSSKKDDLPHIYSISRFLPLSVAAELLHKSVVNANRSECSKIQHIYPGLNICESNGRDESASLKIGIPCIVYSARSNPEKDFEAEETFQRVYGCDIIVFAPRSPNNKPPHNIHLEDSLLSTRNIKIGSKRHKSISSTMIQYGHSAVDLLILNYEGNELPIIQSALGSNAIKRIRHTVMNLYLSRLTSSESYERYAEMLLQLKSAGFVNYLTIPSKYKHKSGTGIDYPEYYTLYFYNKKFNDKAELYHFVSPSRPAVKLPDDLKFRSEPLYDTHLHEFLPTEIAEERLYRWLQKSDIHCHSSERLGSLQEGGWNICTAGIYKPRAPCLIYSFGYKADLSFEDTIGLKYGCRVRSFDPTLSNEAERNSFVSVYPYGLNGKDTNIDVKGRKAQFFTFHSILKKFDEVDSVIDYLKFDIEWIEWDVLENFFKGDGLKNVKQLGFEIHFGDPSAALDFFNSKMFTMRWRLLKRLEEKGFARWHAHANPKGFYIDRELRTYIFEVYYLNLSMLTG
ncbi:unnamed protein product [Dimorphilus gyrociliatus]|nr:unnamed protein product [Dimorphilus gyrociliatus]